MPKKAAAPAAEAKKAPAPAPKEEKADSPAAEKKPAQQKNQPKQEKQPRQERQQNNKAAAPAVPAAPVVEEKEQAPVSNTPPYTEKRVFPISDDPEEAKIQNKLNAFEKEINDYRVAIDAIRPLIDEKTKKKNDALEARKVLFQKSGQIGKADEMNEKTKKARDVVDAAIKASNDRKEELKKFKGQMVGGADERDFLLNVEKRIRAEEAKIATGLSLIEEKKVVQTIGQLQQSKKLYKQYQELQDSSKQLEAQISIAREEQRKLRSEADVFYAKKGEVSGEIKISNTEIDGLSAAIETAIKNRNELRDKITLLQESAKAARKELKDYRDKRRDGRQAEFEKQKKERQAEQDRIKQQRQAERERYDQDRKAETKKREEDKKQRELKRLQEELEQGPYAEELELCRILIKHLEPLVPRVPKAEGEASPAVPDKATPPPVRADNGPEGVELVREKDDSRPLSKQNKKKAPPKPVDLEKELKHSVDTFVQFEQLSLAPPSKVGDVEAAITQLKEKRTYYQKKAEEKKVKQKAEIEAAKKAQNSPGTETKAEPKETPASE